MLKMRKPATPATSELSKMLIFELWTIAALSKAKTVIKIDIVNPIPPKKPAAMICFQSTSSGNSDKPILTAKKLNKAMPKGLPTSNPAKMPKLFDVIKPSVQFPVSAMPVFASAKSGMMINATGLCKKCCNLWDGDFLSPSPKGMVKARRTPAIEAWIPDLSIKYHMIKPGTR